MALAGRRLPGEPDPGEDGIDSNSNQWLLIKGGHPKQTRDGRHMISEGGEQKAMALCEDQLRGGFACWAT